MDNQAGKEIELLTRSLVLTNDELKKIEALLRNSFKEGLQIATHPDAPVKMFPTFIGYVPSGDDKYAEGKFLALDLGGTNFRVLLIELNEGNYRSENEVYAVPIEIMHGTGEQLFDYIASCLASFMNQRKMKDLRLPLGFTFSFPTKQESIASAKLVAWTKGFKCKGVEGEDVAELLRQAIKRRGDVKIDVMAVVNDTTGTLVSCAHQNQDCRIGLIIGTGLNACYMETLENVETFHEDFADINQIIINTEFGAFGDDNVLNFMRTEWDLQVDENSINPKQRLFEKLISGMYLGEISRYVMAEMTKRKLLFNGKGSTKLYTPYSFQTAFMSGIESDKKNEYILTLQALSALDIHHATIKDCESVKLICSRVSSRAAHLVSAAVACILNKMKRPQTTVGVDGSVVKYHPTFKRHMEEKVAELVNPSFKFDIMLSEDGSGRGAALCAAVATVQEKRRKTSRNEILNNMLENKIAKLRVEDDMLDRIRLTVQAS